MSVDKTSKINRLLQKSNQGGVYMSSWLKANGYSDQLLKKYRDSGWLVALCKGVMYRAGDKLNTLAVLESYNEQLNKDYHIAAHSALEIAGFNHYVPMGKSLLIISHPSKDLVPSWLKNEVFDQKMKFFSTETFSELQLMLFNSNYPHLRVSVPEQAFLECLLLAPKEYSYMDLYYIMEQLTTLRPGTLQTLLENTKNYKVKRMFLYMAEKAGHYWFDLLDTDKIELGSSIFQLVKNGVYIPKYKITVSQELYDYE